MMCNYYKWLHFLSGVLASEWCRDNSTLNCWYYPDEKCVGTYEGWARVYCPYRCGYCPSNDIFYNQCKKSRIMKKKLTDNQCA